MRKDESFYCPGCGLEGGDGSLAADTSCNASSHCWKYYQELTIYTLSLGDSDFIHQHVIDAYTAQHSSSRLKGIQICFALIGLYLFLEHSDSGRAVQQAHRRLAEKTKKWPQLLYERPVTAITIRDVLLPSSLEERVIVIHHWAEITWQAWQDQRQRVLDLYALALD